MPFLSIHIGKYHIQSQRKHIRKFSRLFVADAGIYIFGRILIKKLGIFKCPVFNLRMRIISIGSCIETNLICHCSAVVQLKPTLFHHIIQIRQRGIFIQIRLFISCACRTGSVQPQTTCHFQIAIVIKSMFVI